MSRPIFLSNGSLAVGLDRFGSVHDFYYPYVGLENHASTRHAHHKIGVWVDGAISWLDEAGWQITLDYEPDALIGKTLAANEKLSITLEFTDFTDFEQNAFIRSISLKNLADTRRQIKLYMHQVFRISDSHRDDTALYLPDSQAIMHYKGRRVFLVGGVTADQNFDQYTVGLHGIEGHEGTYRDAEDGNLSANPVEHGTVDSTIGFSLEVDGRSTASVYYWVCAGLSRKDVLEMHSKLRAHGVSERLDLTRSHWQKWLEVSHSKRSRVEPKWQEALTKCLLIIKSHIDRRGAVIASGDSEMLNYSRDYYSYCWPRDAAYALWPLVRLGYFDEAKQYFEFARDVLHPDGYLMHKYQPDRAIGSSWHPFLFDGQEALPIQEDETAITIFLLGEYLKTSGDTDFVRAVYSTLVQPAANFMDSYVDSDTKLPHPSYDLWEQKFSTSTYTTALVVAALYAAADMADEFEYPDDAIRWRNVADDIKLAAQTALFNAKRNYFYKGLIRRTNNMLEHDDVVDISSLFGAVMFGLYPSSDERVKKSASVLEQTLVDKSPSLGIPRYEYDGYYQIHPDSLGNPWIVTTLWHAQYLIENGQRDSAYNIVEWAQSHMLTSGVLPEQINPDTGDHISVAPLVWSQAEFINTVLDLSRI